MSKKKLILTSIIYSLFLFVSFIFVSCIGEIKSPVLPIWNTEFDLPLVNREETVKELLKDEKRIFIDSLSMLLRFDTIETKTTTIDEIFKNDVKFDDRFVVKVDQLENITFKTFIFDSTARLQEFWVKKGLISYKVTNYLNKAIKANLKIPGFTRNNLDTLKFSADVPANSVKDFSINLANYKYKALSSNPLNNPNQGIYIEGDANIGSGYSSDSIAFDIKVDSIQVNYFKGTPKAYTTTIDKNEKIDLEKEIRDILPSIDIKSAKVLLNSNLNIKDIEVALKNIKIVGKFNDGTPSKLLKVNGKTIFDTLIQLNQPVQLSVSNFSFHEFISPKVPDSVSVVGDIVFNPNNKQLELKIEDSIKYSVQMLVESILKVDDAHRADHDSIKQLDQDQKDNLDRVQEGTISIEFLNPFPVGLKLYAYAADANNNKLLVLTREKGDGSADDTLLNIAPAGIRIVNGVGVSDASLSALNLKKIKFTGADIQKLKEINFVYYDVTASTTNKQMVQIDANMKYRVKMTGLFKINIKAPNK